MNCVAQHEVMYNIPKDAYELNITLLVKDDQSGLNGFIGGKLSLENDEQLFSKNSYGSQCDFPTKKWIQQNKVFQQQVEELDETFYQMLYEKPEIKESYRKLKKYKENEKDA